MKPLRDYQLAACDAIVDEWTRVRSTLLVAATGTGKSRMGAEIIHRRAPFGRTLWLAHRSELLDQAVTTISENTGLRVGREQAQQRAQVRSLWGADDQVVVGSIQTMHSDRLSKFFKPSDFDTIIVDEAHHALARSYRDVLAYFDRAKILGVTATPDRGDKLGLFQVFDTVAFQYEILQGIADGYLCDLQSREIVIGGLDLSHVRTTAGDLNAGELAELMESEEHLHSIAIPLVREAGDRQTVVFMPNVASSHHLASVLRGYTSSPIRAIDGNTAKSERDDALSEYAAGRVQFLVNCAILTEGWDAPSTSCVAIARPTKSRALYAQMIGRGTRLAPGKENCLVLDFVPEQAGRHKLVNPIDVLGGKDLDDDVVMEAKRLTGEGMPASEALSAAEEAKATRQREERLRDEMRAKKVRAEAEYRVRRIDPFGCLDPDDMVGPRAKAKTLAEMESLRLTPPPDVPEQAARKMINEAIRRQKLGYPTPKVTAILHRRGLRSDIHHREASAIIDAILKNGPDQWRNPTPADILAKYGKKKK